MIAIIDYGAGNLQSVKKAFDFIGVPTKVTSDPNELLAAKAAVLPGVGAFGDSMAALESLNMTQPIRDFIASDRPFLGICLGLQMLFESSEESPGVPGLGVLKGSIARIPAGEGLKIPHIGWNSLSLRQTGGLFPVWKQSRTYILSTPIICTRMIHPSYPHRRSTVFALMRLSAAVRSMPFSFIRKRAEKRDLPC